VKVKGQLREAPIRRKKVGILFSQKLDELDFVRGCEPSRKCIANGQTWELKLKQFTKYSGSAS
jgi:hypothetical protein